MIAKAATSPETVLMNICLLLFGCCCPSWATVLQVGLHLGARLSKREATVSILLNSPSLSVAPHGDRNPRRTAGHHDGEIPLSPLPLLEHEERAGRDQRKANEVIPAERLLQEDKREAREHQQRDHLLNGLQLRHRIDGAAITIGRHGEGIFDQRDGPADNDDLPQRYFFELEVAVPRECHEQV